MELRCRSRGDEFLRHGELTAIRGRLRRIAGRHDVASVIACAFEHRTRMLPLVYVTTHMVPGGVRAIGSAMVDSGLPKTRIVLQQWNRNFRPSQMRLDGRTPDILMVSSIQIYTAACKALIRDACRIDPARRPLIIAGGPKAIYQPWDLFSADPRAPWGADVAVTGEEYVLLNLLEVLLSIRGSKEPLRSAFLRARDGGMLEGVPGLVYARGRVDGVAEELIDTGPQRLVRDLDELPDPVLGYRLLEPPSRKATLGSRALPPDRVRRHSWLGALVITCGCKLSCPFCPIPAYNQRQFRSKSGPRLAEEMVRLHREYGIREFFGCDDNFLNDRSGALEIAGVLARTEIDGVALHRRIRWATEATVHDAYRMREHLPLLHRAGIRGLWLGVEDMTATLINKGQTVAKTTEVFDLLRRHGIVPFPMMIHHDRQPLYTRGSDYGLLNQARLLRKSGALAMQVLMLTPTVGSRTYEEAFNTGLVFQRVGGRAVEPHMFDGNYVIQSACEKPWRKQLNIIATYLYFYNPLRLLQAIVRPGSQVLLADPVFQILGMCGLVQTLRRTLGWALRLMLGRIERTTTAPASPIAIRSPRGSRTTRGSTRSIVVPRAGRQLETTCP